jgi:hypothetical protein
MKIIVRCVITTVLIPFTGHMHAQNLILVKKNRILMRFTKGDNIRYAVLTSGALITGKIVSIMPDHFVTGSDTIRISEVTRLDVRHSQRRKALRSSGIKLITAGVLLGLGDYINVTVVQDQHYSFQPGVAITSMALIVTGFSLHWAAKREIKIKRHTVLMSVE